LQPNKASTWPRKYTPSQFLKSPFILASYKAPDKPNRQKARMELLQTERSYLQDLTVAFEIFMKPIKEEKILEPNIIQNIFGNMEDLIQFTQKTISMMEIRIERDNRDMSLEEIAKDISPRLFEVYSKYTSNYMKSFYELEKQINFNEDFHKWLNKANSNPKLNWKELSDFLILPVQRIPRYILLTKQILKETSVLNQDWVGLQVLIKKLEEVLDKINNGQKQNKMPKRSQTEIFSFTSTVEALVRSKSYYGQKSILDLPEYDSKLYL